MACYPWHVFCPFISRVPHEQKVGEAMETTTTSVPMSSRTLGIISLILGLCGGAFYWWTPLGIVLSLSGLLTGFIGWTFARRKTSGFAMVIGAMLICIAALILDTVIASLGLEFIQFQDLHG